MTCTDWTTWGEFGGADDRETSWEDVRHALCKKERKQAQPILLTSNNAGRVDFTCPKTGHTSRADEDVGETASEAVAVRARMGTEGNEARSVPSDR